jgi:hypothetical protein
MKNSGLQQEIVALKGENLKHCRQIAKLKAEITTLESRITILTEDYAKYRADNPPLNMPQTEEHRKIVDEHMKAVLRKRIQEKSK